MGCVGLGREFLLRRPALHPSPTLRMVRGGSQNPDVAVVPVRSSVGGPPSRDSSGPVPARSSFCFPREHAPRRHPMLRFVSVSANSPAYRDKLQANSGTAGGRASPSSDALLPLFIWLSIRLGDSGVITCKVPPSRNCMKNQQFTGSGLASGA